MRRQSYRMEILTPCFCAGANQAEAELRPSALRGEMRWWFRALGGTREMEQTVFGHAAGEEGRSGAFALRFCLIEKGPAWDPPDFSPNQARGYVYHFAKESSKGRRWNRTGNVPPGTTFQLDILWHRALADQVRTHFESMLEAFLRFGGIGLRVTRGLGAWHCHGLDHSDATVEQATEALRTRGFAVARREEAGPWPTWEGALADWSAWLRYDLRKDHKAAQPGPLGGIEPSRQSRQGSAIRFRCLRNEDGSHTWLAFEAPHERVLGEQSRATPPRQILAGRSFIGAKPTPVPR